MHRWIQLRVETGAANGARVARWLEDHGALSVSTESARPEQDAYWLQEATEWRQPAWRRVRLTGLFDADRDTQQIARGLRRWLGEGGHHRVTLDTLPDSDWSQAWRGDWGEMRFGERLVVRPEGQPGDSDGEAVVLLEPGLAFGTGSHATTALCLERLAEESLAGRDVLDFGCGSGILAIAALALGARSALAVDVDPQALDATRANAARNGIGSELVVGFPHELADAPCADIVIANILANTLVRLAPRLMTLARPGAGLWLSGLLGTQVTAVAAAYASRFHFCARRRDEWVLLVGR